MAITDTAPSPKRSPPVTLCAYAHETISHKARRLIGRYGFAAQDRQDIEQELTAHLLRALRRFNPSVANRHTFIARVIDHKISNIIREKVAPMRDYRLHGGCIDGDDAAQERLPRNVLDAHEHRHDEQRDLRIDIVSITASLPDDLADLCLRLQTQTVLEISRATGIPRWQLYESVARLRVIFSRAGLSPNH